MWPSSATTMQRRKHVPDGASEEKRQLAERNWLVGQQVFWWAMALAAAGIVVLGYVVALGSGPSAGEYGAGIMIAGVVGIAVSGTLAIAALVEMLRWRKVRRSQ